MRRTFPTIVSLAITLAATSTLHAQTPQQKERAREMGLDAIKLVDEGELDKGLKMLQEASALDPEETVYKYEQGYVYFMKKEYQSALKLIEPLLASPEAEDRYYQLVGNCYDYLKNPEKAIKTYNAGLKRFPNSGELHLELGVMAFGEKDYDKAVAIWEEGLNVDPMHPSNYYWAAKLYCNSDRKLWGVLYAETFLNLEPNTDRSVEISKLLYDTYNKGLKVSEDSARMDFEDIVVKKMGKDGKPVLPLIAPYSMTMALSVTPVQIKRHEEHASGEASELTIADLHQIRSQFTKTWFEKGQNREYPSVLFDRQRAIAEAGFEEPYNYMILSQGNPEEFEKWMMKNEEKFRSFVDWFVKNPLRIPRDKGFNRISVDERSE